MIETHPAWHPAHGFAEMPLGRLPARQDDRTLKLANYLDTARVLPHVPATCDLTAEVASWPMYGNDEEGDCTIAAAGHMVQAWTAANMQPVTPPDAGIQLAYWETGDPPAATGTAGGPTDTGRVELDVLKYWRRHGIAGHKIAAFASVNPRNLEHVRAAVYLFGGVYLGVALPVTAQAQRVWDVEGDPTDPHSAAYPGSWGGHAVPELAYVSGSSLSVVTWGGVLQMTERFHLAYVEEAYALISPDWAPSGRSPDGFDLERLRADLAVVSH